MRFDSDFEIEIEYRVRFIREIIKFERFFFMTRVENLSFLLKTLMVISIAGKKDVFREAIKIGN